MLPSLAGSEFEDHCATSIQIDESSRVGEARRIAASISEKLGFDDVTAGRVAIIVAEAAKNIVAHAGSGLILLRRLVHANQPGLEIQALDKGPGMANVAECISDGFSTGGTQGIGLGAIKRLSNVFDIHSQPGMGTGILSQVWAGDWKKSLPWQHGAVCTPIQSETVCGDAWAVHEETDRALVMIVDGLGHGKYASEAAAEAVKVFGENRSKEPLELILLMHGALKKTRGAAAAVALIDRLKSEVRFSGVGNISGFLHHPKKAKAMLSTNGTLGHQIHKPQQLEYPWTDQDILLMYSDGISSLGPLERYGALARRNPALLAGVLFRDHRRGRDDATILAMRANSLIDD